MTLLIRQLLGPLKIPQRVGAGGILLHALPRSDYTRFETETEAEQAIAASSSAMEGFGLGDVEREFEILTVERHDASEADRELRISRAARAQRQRQKDPEEE